MTVRVYTGGAPIQVIDEAPVPVNPTIVGFAATPGVITAGQSVMLNATVLNTVSMKLNGADVLSFPQAVTPTVTTTYMLVATGAPGTTPAVQSLSVTVNPAVPDLPQATIVTKIANRPRAIIMGSSMPDLSGHVVFVGFSDGGRYSRMQEPLEWMGQKLPADPIGSKIVHIRGIIETTVAPQLTWGTAWNAVVTLKPRVGPTITLPPVAVSATTTFFNVDVDLNTIPEVDGGYLMSVTGAPAGWTVLDYPVYPHLGAAPSIPQTWMLAVVGSYSHEQLKMDGQHHHSYAWVPAKFDPVMIPLPPRTYPKVAAIAPIVPGQTMNEMAKFTYTMVVPLKEDDVYRPSKLPSGVWTTANSQNYGFNTFYERPEPGWVVLQGPRGRGNMVCPTALRVTARTDTPGKFLFCQPHNVGDVIEDGTVHIEWGYYHDEPPSYANWDFFKQQRPKAPLKFAGGWASSVPVARRVVQELWDVAVDARTVAVDETSPLIGTPPQHSHVINVVKYVTETATARTSFGGRVLKLTYGKNDLARTATAEEFINYPIGTKPWGCEMFGNLLLVTLVGPKLVNAYNVDTGVLVWSKQMPAPPYGIRIMDGIAYIGTFPTISAVWKLDVAAVTAAVSTNTVDAVPVTKFFDALVNSNSAMMNISVDDGSFIERGGVAYVNWSNNTYGWPVYHGADGKRLPIGAGNNSWGSPKGTLMPPGLSYAASVAIGNGQMLWGTVQDGLHRISAALPTDQTVPAACFLGYQKFWNLDLHLTNDDYGWGTKGCAQAWDIDPDINAMLLNQGHTKS